MRVLLLILGCCWCAGASAQLFASAKASGTLHSICEDGIPPIKPMMTMDCAEGDDYWAPIAKNESDLFYRCELHNRWGEVVRTSTNPEDRYDFTTTSGELLPAGAYLYTVSWYCTGNPADAIEQNGIVTLVR